MDKDTIKLSPDVANIVELMYETPKTGTNSYGNWYLYGVIKDGIETGFFATDALHKKLSVYGQGAKVSITKEEYAPGKSAWTVEPLSGTTPKPTTAISYNNIDARTHDIHKQVCLKLAVEMFGGTKDILKDQEVVAIETNMKVLLSVLESEEIVKDLTSSVDPVKNDDMPY
tara:strand:- start:2059 stop:2571 length:513 start_codon:yes stop_codon:yes gene_type:complete